MNKIMRERERERDVTKRERATSAHQLLMWWWGVKPGEH